MEQVGTITGILMPAFIAGLIVLSTHVPLGKEVLKRGIVFFDLAIAQVAALGVLVAESLGVDALMGAERPWLVNVVAMLAAVVGASALFLVRNASSRTQEALIGVVFMLASTGSLMLLASDPHGGERLQAMLTGQILWVDTDVLVLACILSLLLLVFWFGFPSARSGFGFYPIFAVAVTLSTQLVGVYLVFASLILPALATLGRSSSLLAAYGVGVAGYLLGLCASGVWDLPSGALIAWVMALVALVYHLASPRERTEANDKYPH